VEIWFRRAQQKILYQGVYKGGCSGVCERKDHLDSVMAIGRTYFLQRRIGGIIRLAEQWIGGIELNGIAKLKGFGAHEKAVKKSLPEQMV
jgi:hypothetical protein